MKKLKLLSLFLAIAIFTTVIIPFQCYALERSVPTGNGTEASPYLIETVGELYWFADQLNDGKCLSSYVKLISNIVVNEGNITAESNPENTWLPMGYNQTANFFNGVFDGNGYVVSGLFYNGNSRAGFFSRISNSAVVKNLTIDNSYIKSSDYVGGICAYSSGRIENCTNKATVEGSNYVGGICAYSVSTVTQCVNNGACIGKTNSDGTGGICGYSSSTISNCYNLGNISGTNKVAGICGRKGNGKIENCYNIGIITGTTKGAISGYNSGTYTNNYYLVQDALKGINGVSADNETKTKSMTETQFKTGEVCYLLNGGANQVDTPVWGQIVGQDLHPELKDAPINIVDNRYVNDIYFSSAKLALGSDLAIKYTVVIGNETKYVDSSNLSVEFTMNGTTVTVNKYNETATGYEFVFSGITPQYMYDEIDATINYDGKKVGVYNDYSVKKYCDNVYQENTTNTKLVRLLADLLTYGAEAQKYVNYKLDQLDDEPSWVSENKTQFGQSDITYLEDNNKKTVLVDTKDNDNRITATGLFLSNRNYIIVHVKITDVENGKLNIYRGGSLVGSYKTKDMTDIGGGIYEIKTNALYAVENDVSFQFELISGETIKHTVRYSANSYVLVKYTNETVGELSKALYCYGRSAEEYVG